jgi:hypothetical protein
MQLQYAITNNIMHYTVFMQIKININQKNYTHVAYIWLIRK